MIGYIGYIWTRESNRFDKEKYSILAQLDACRAAAQADGVEVTPEREFQVQFSGRDLFLIPELNELRELIKTPTGAPKVVYCYTQDRLIRGEEAIDIFYLLVDFRRQNTQVKFVKDPVDTKSVVGQVMLLFGGYKSSTEIDDIVDRTMRGKKKRVQEGKLWGLGRDKFGYRKDRELGVAMIHEPEAEVIRRIFRDASEGKGNLTIARALNDEGIPTSFTGKGEPSAKWHPATVRHFLRDPAYKGEVWSGRFGSGDPERMADGLFPPIVDAALWERVQRRLETNRGEHVRNQKHPALLRGLVYCVCGQKLYFLKHVEKRADGADKLRYYYRCAWGFMKRDASDPGRCDRRQARADRLEGEVWEAAVELFDDPDRLVEIVNGKSKRETAERLESRRGAFAKEIERKETEQKRLARRLREADDRVAEVIEREIFEVADEIERARRDLAEVEAALNDTMTRQIAAERIRTLCATAAPRMRESKSFDEKRRILEGLHIRVVWDGEEWEFSSGALVSSEKVFNKTFAALPKPGAGNQ